MNEKIEYEFLSYETTERQENMRMKYIYELEGLESILSAIDIILK